MKLLTLIRRWQSGALAWSTIFLLGCIATPCVRAGTVLTTDWVLHEGEMSLDNGIVVRASPATVKLTISNILRARFSAPPSDEFQPGVLLAAGGRIAGPFSSLGESNVRFDRKRISIPGKEVAWAIYQPFNVQLAEQVPRGKTGALLPGGDFFEGTPRGGDSNTAKVLNPIFGPRTFDARRKEIHALILREIQPQPAAFEVLTRDGSIYPALDVLTSDSLGVTLRHPLYDGFRVPLADLVEIRASSTRLMPLDSLKPSRVDPAPGREAANCFAANRSLDGGPLKLGNRSATTGFETASGATIWWKAPLGPGTFVTLVAASPSTPSGQKLVFSVYADSRLAAQSKPLGAGDPPMLLRCTLPAIGNLTLRIEGTEGSGTWAEPILLRR